jgi:exopolysaccharide biosynthesis polyprenyl glycosylphosphotransferase
VALSAIRAPLEWRTVVRPPRPPLAVVIPGVDVIALGGALILTGRSGALGLVYGLGAIAALASSGLERARINPRLSDDLPALLAGLALPMLFLIPFAHSNAQLGRAVRLAPVAIGLVLLGRAGAYRAIRETRARGFILEPTLIIGAGRHAIRVAETLQAHPEYGLVPVGFLDSFLDQDLPLPILGDVPHLEMVVREFEIRRIIVAFGATREPEMVPIIRACDRLPVEVHVIPRFFELGMAGEGRYTDDVWGIPLIRLRRSALRSAAWRTKRAVDLVVGSLLLVLASPLFVGAALAIRLSSPGPIFFRQKRVGQRGVPFELLKFRTLRQNDDSDTTWSVAEDQRRTAIGAFLRRTGLDELPQLINVLRGEMSLVGPRPERPYFVDRFRVTVQGYEDRHRVPAGITGWAQVHGLRGDTSIEARAIFDNDYVENWSLWRDLVIMGRTIGAMFGGTGA